MADWGLMLMAILAAGSMLILFNWRRPVELVRVIQINKKPEEVWSSIDYAAGDISWQEHLDGHSVSACGGKVSLSHSMSRDDGSKVGWGLDFDIVAREPGKRIVLERSGVDPKNTNDRLLKVDISLTPKASGTEVALQEHWGPRSLTGLALAHMDAANALARLKSWCETGKAHPAGSRGWAAAIISAASLVATAAAFSLLLGWEIGVIFVGLLVLHEFGHLISFRMIGQPWGKIVFMPFLGGVAVSRVPHLRLADDAFCAIMGAGLSVFALAPAIIVTTWDIGSPAIVHTAYAIAAIAGALNLLNLLPVYPLDGGRVLRAVMQSILPNRVRDSMFALAGLVGLAGVLAMNPILVAIAVVAFFQSASLGPARDNIALMSPGGSAIMCIAYLSLVAVHATAAVRYWPSLI
jgi:Zn-dependent protease